MSYALRRHLNPTRGRPQHSDECVYPDPCNGAEAGQK